MRKSRFSEDTPQEFALSGYTILVVEDDYLQASDLADLVRAERGHVIGPVPSLNEGLELVRRAEAIHCAVLDIKLGELLVYPLVERLRQQSTPVIFISGYDQSAIPESFAAIPLCQKPIQAHELRGFMVRALADRESFRGAGVAPGDQRRS